MTECRTSRQMSVGSENICNHHNHINTIISPHRLAALATESVKLNMRTIDTRFIRWLIVKSYTTTSIFSHLFSIYSLIKNAALRSRCGHYIFALWFCFLYLLSSFFIPRLISTVAHWMSTILLHMVWR